MISYRFPFTPAASLVTFILVGCSGATDAPVFDITDRMPGMRQPITMACDPMDATRCLLPWPSSAYTVADASTSTGLRVHLAPTSFIGPDDPASLNRADGFSRVTPLVTAFSADIPQLMTSSGQGSVRLLLAQPGAVGFGMSVPLRFDVQQNTADDGHVESFIFGYPLRPLAPNSDYVAVVLDDLPVTGGVPLSPAHLAQVALGLSPPLTSDEAQLAGYHAPTRAVLRAAGIDSKHVLRVWDFTTRSDADPQQRLAAMRAGVLAAVNAGQVTVHIDKVDTTTKAPVAMTVLGHLDGLPKYIDPTPGSALTLDAKGLAVASGTRTAPFRVVVPTGLGNYRFVMYGHGTGGSYDESTFDTEIASGGAAKIGIQFDGWTGDDVIETFVGFMTVFKGSHYAAAMLMQALSDAAAVQVMLPAAIGEALAAPMIAGVPNPAAGRRPDSSQALWAGGSLGGILGLVAVCIDPTVHYGVLNVPGAAWTHYIPKSLFFTMISSLLQTTYHSEVNALHALAISQGNWDEIDGAAWSSALVGRTTAFLIQESIGDPVVPNPGSEMVAVVTGAKQVGAVLVRISANIQQADEVDGASGITQYHVTSTDPLKIHGFAAQDTPAGRAARSQIVDFVNAIWTAGQPKIAVPAGCTAGSCDFTIPKP